jgi:hypothetical protein
VERDPQRVPYVWREIDEAIVLRTLVSASTLAEVDDPNEDRSSRRLGGHEHSIAVPPAMLLLCSQRGTSCAVEVDSFPRIPRRLPVSLGVIVRRDAVERREERLAALRIDGWSMREREISERRREEKPE